MNNRNSIINTLPVLNDDARVKRRRMQTALKERGRKRTATNCINRENTGTGSGSLQVAPHQISTAIYRSCNGDSRQNNSYGFGPNNGWIYRDPELKCNGIPSLPGGNNPNWWDEGRVLWANPEGEKAMNEHQRNCVFSAKYDQREMEKLLKEERDLQLNLPTLTPGFVETKFNDNYQFSDPTGNPITSKRDILMASAKQFEDEQLDRDEVVEDTDTLLDVRIPYYMEMIKEKKKERIKQIKQRQKQKKRELAAAKKKKEKQQHDTPPPTTTRRKSSCTPSCIVMGGKKRKNQKTKNQKREQKNQKREQKN